MSFKVTFIFYNNFTAYSWSPAIQALSSYIKQHANCETTLIHINDKYGVRSNHESVIERLNSIKPDLIAFTSTSFGFYQINELAGSIKKVFSAIPIILGGIHSTIKPDDLEDSNFDAFCIGEGEKPLVTLIKKMQRNEDYFSTPSFHFKSNRTIIRNVLEPYEKNLDNLPPYDWEIFDTHKLLKLREGWVSLSLSRGCPFNCNFCINHKMKEIQGAKGYVRHKSVGRAISELLYLISRFPIKVFNFEDDILISSRSWASEFLSRYKNEIYEKYGIRFKVEARVDMITESIIKELKTAGCQEIQFGVETGNSMLRNFILNKNISDDQILNAFTLCWKYHINTLAFVMMGIPGETVDTIMDTVIMLSKIKSYLIRPAFIFPIYGTGFYSYCLQNNLLKEDILKYKSYLWTEGVPIYLKDISEESLIRYIIMLPWYINVELGLKDYEKMIKKYASLDFINVKNKKLSFQLILEEDRRQSLYFSENKISHYRYLNQELSYLQYNFF